MAARFVKSADSEFVDKPCYTIIVVAKRVRSRPFRLGRLVVVGDQKGRVGLQR